MATDVRSIWRFISNFFNFLTWEDRERYENIWEGQALATHEMDKKAVRFVLSQSPQESDLTPTIDYYDVPVGITKARPIQLDPTQASSRYIIIPKKLIKSIPVPTGRDSVRNDLIEIGPQDYGDIKDIGVGTYCVIDVDNDDIPKKYFKVKNLKAPTETDPTRYSDLYVIELENANLSYIPDDIKFTVYLTTGKVYRVDEFVIDIPYLYTDIQEFNSLGNLSGGVFEKDVDFTFEDSTIEFNEDLIEGGIFKDGDILYAKNINIIEHNLFSIFGTLVGIKDWRKFKYDNISGKIAINSLVKSFQNPSKRENYERALNVCYGLPIAPTNLTVVGMYESYGYEITNVDTGNTEVTLDLKTATTLHYFIQPGSKFLIEDKNTEVEIPYNATESVVINRSTGVIKLNSVADLVVGDKLNVRLANRLKFKKIEKPSFSDSILTAIHWTAGGEFQHLKDIIYGIGQQENFIRYPELLIYDSKDEGISKNFDGLYHIKQVQAPTAGYTDSIEIMIDDRVILGEEPNYNDFIDVNDGQILNVGPGYIHIPWPTHKYLLVTLDDGSYYKLYIDSPIDTLYEEGDKANIYDVLCRCISSFDQSVFPFWNEFNGFRPNSGIDLESHMLELIDVIPYTKFGTYFQNSV